MLPVLVIAPYTGDAPEEYSEGTSPTNEPIVPVNRSQSRSRPASAKVIRLLTPRTRQPTHERSELAVGRHYCDGVVELVTPRFHGEHGAAVQLECNLQRE